MRAVPERRSSAGDSYKVGPQRRVPFSGWCAYFRSFLGGQSCCGTGVACVSTHCFASECLLTPRCESNAIPLFGSIWAQRSGALRAKPPCRKGEDLAVGSCCLFRAGVVVNVMGAIGASQGASNHTAHRTQRVFVGCPGLRLALPRLVNCGRCSGAAQRRPRAVRAAANEWNAIVARELRTRHSSSCAETFDGRWNETTSKASNTDIVLCLFRNFGNPKLWP